MKAAIPTLSKAGIITDPKQGMLYLFKSFLTIDKSVSNHHRSRVHSLVYLIKQLAKSPEELRTAVEDSLTEMYTVHFDKVQVQVELATATDLDLSETPAVTLSMALLVEDEGVSYQLSAVLEDAFKESDRMYDRVVFKGT